MVWCRQATGSGFRGGTWNNDGTNARVSDRNNAANTNTDRNNNNGARAAKTFHLPGRRREFLSPAFAFRIAMIDNVFDTIIHRENLYRAAYAAAKGKRTSPAVARFNFFMEREVSRLHDELKSGVYRHGPYKVFKIYEPKERDIAKALFRDRVVHHAVHDVIEPVIDRTFIFDSYACRNGKGTHIALDRAQSFLRANKYCFHGDVRKYFPSIDHGILKRLIRRYVSDRRLLWLTDHVIDTSVALSPAGEAVGLPIGNLTSQFFANLYLHELDHFVKHGLQRRYYIRYMDDFLVFADSREELEIVRSRIRLFLKEELNLNLHDAKSQIYKNREGVKFLGFRLFNDGRRVAQDSVRRLRKRLAKFKYLLARGWMKESVAVESVLCWKAHSGHANAAGLGNALAQEVATWNLALSATLLYKPR